MRASPICVVFWASSLLRAERRVASTPSPSGPPPIVQPGPPGQPSRVITAEAAADVSKVEYIDADIKFMQGMIGHHAQAIEMVTFIPTHSEPAARWCCSASASTSPRHDEITMMQEWLRVRGQQVPGVNAMHAHGATLMPGMLTEEEMARLAPGERGRVRSPLPRGDDQAPRGRDHDGQGFVRHPGAGQDVSVFSFANDVDIDQRMEIQRMGALLDVIAKEMQ